MANRPGHPMTPEINAKISATKRGRPSTFKGKHHTVESKAKLAKAHLGKKLSVEHRAKISASGKGKHLGCCNWGSKNGRWLGGLSYEPYCPKFNKDLRQRIRAFFDYRCVTCGKSTDDNRKELCCHHVEYSKSACCDGEPVHFAALCGRCHIKTNFERARWEAMLHRIIDEIYDGRSYFTKEEYKQVTA